VAAVVTGGAASASAATLTTTYHHPFYDVTRGAFVEAVNLQVGDRLQTADGGEASVEEVTPYHSTEVTYDLTIDQLHTYYVFAGDTPVLVHNCGGEVAVDTNVVSDALSGGRAEHVDAALNGRSPVVSPKALAERQSGGHAEEDVTSWLEGRGGRVGSEATQGGINGIQDALRTLWRGKTSAQ